jgi:hypothetical protein
MKPRRRPLIVILAGQILDVYGRSRVASGATLPQPQARLIAIDELDASRFQSTSDGLNSFRRHDSAASLEIYHG